MASSLVKSRRQDAFDAVDLGCHITWGEGGDLGDGGGVETFEIGKDDLTVERFQLPDKFEKPRQSFLSIRG
jgi:hypothetical protein